MAKKVNENVAKPKKVNVSKTKATKVSEENQGVSKSKKHFQTPTETWWGKLIVWIIMFGMVGLIILSFILAVLEGTA
ncbi:MAG: hypothetical protein JXC31_05185 [Acholeplasmataceae bacterium]|nr:hypothetical protein [Acholeplasmataceae bacterium]